MLECSLLHAGVVGGGHEIGGAPCEVEALWRRLEEAWEPPGGDASIKFTTLLLLRP